MRRAAAASRATIVEQLRSKRVHTYSLERTDLGLLRGLRLLAEQREDPAVDRNVLGHAALEPLLDAFAVLRGWRTEIRSADSKLAVTPGVEALLLILDSHLALLRVRRVALAPEKRVVADHVVSKSGTPTYKLWKFSGVKLAAAARLIELPAFELYVRQLRDIERGAQAIASRITGDAPGRRRARAQHEALASTAGRLSRLLDKSLAGMRL